MTARLALLAPALALAACGPTRGAAAPEPAAPAAGASTWSGPTYDEAFGARWYDGKAELARYALTYPRYGAPREGVAVAITVAEHLDLDTRVKPERDPSAGAPTLKLNLVEEFQTGIYDYDLMTSGWVALRPAVGRPAGAPLEVKFSAQEWCGMTFERARFEAGHVARTLHGYFEGEANRRDRLEAPADTYAEDLLILWARGLGGPAVPPGGRAEVPLLRSLALARLRHVPTAVDRAVLTRQAQTERVEVPAGTFEAEVATAHVRADGPVEGTLGGPAPAEARERTWTFWVERTGERRLLRLRRSDGLEAALVASIRDTYWTRQAPEDVARLDSLGLRPPQPSPP